MAQRSLEERVDMLERRVELFEQLPERMTALETQIVLLRDEMRAEFSATRADARADDERVMQTLREDIRAGDEHTVQTLRKENEETRQFMRMLHEEVIERIKLLGGEH
jgi:LPS O-antigen subunit length determinant protein (WzzB/FepE family)